MANHLVKQGKRIIGFVWKDTKGQWWYAFGKPSANNYIAFACRSLEHGIASIEMHRENGIGKIMTKKKNAYNTPAGNIGKNLHYPINYPLAV